ncbi:MAG: hypothetical protein CO135_02700 [Candidatus Levybacteria bacterium CG_4_9_14_3_um_filter_35_16]|nr:MAG: hypothetical protein COW87_03730 [Candidatus Levybacteria bacterium CG22_combo_CG10-13_8_21_14_all_35_11]PJA91171.1 MAG: hypothetical protein CO135_02700 [Candidatus Levybacteria bacterium CG_4_9_14_3_um_filter_35_16]PJC54049.1 MAG: hypothetical protein CO028_04530 [Candidatus Levybacteria bacterium CG_4_9_14_0_2_um_filter_35_21]
MRKKRKIIPFLISLIFLGITTYIIVNYPPTLSFSILNYKFSIFYILFVSLFLFVTCFVAYFLKNLRRGFFTALFVAGFLLLNFYKLGQPIFIILLITIFVVLELLFTKSK